VDEIRLSKLLSLVLRHDPGRIGIALDSAGAMHVAGHRFTRSANGVWLVDSVPPSYLTQADGLAEPPSRHR
jgi:RNA:NAD 2'-phosphotransferase (TPT1/KptA family)